MRHRSAPRIAATAAPAVSLVVAGCGAGRARPLPGGDRGTLGLRGVDPRANLVGFRQTVAAPGNNAFAAAAPELMASLKDVSTAYAALNESLATQCKAA